MPYPVISVVVINKNDRGIADTLSLLRQQKKAASQEVIVVDASANKLDDIKHAFQEVNWIPFSSITKKQITIAEQRNVGIRAARGSIVAFIDASCKPDNNWLFKLTQPILNQEEALTAGGTLSTGKATFHDSVYKTHKNNKYISEAPTINLAISKKVFQKVGYFDESLFYGSDLDFTWRANKLGYKIRNVPDALVTHDWGDIKQEVKRSIRYGQAKVKLYRKHKPGLRVIINKEFAIMLYTFYVLLLPVTFWLPYYPLLVLVPLLKNVRTNPFKLVLVNFTTMYGALRELVTN